MDERFKYTTVTAKKQTICIGYPLTLKAESNDKNLALLIALDNSFCFLLDTFVILLGIIFPFSLMYLDNNFKFL